MEKRCFLLVALFVSIVVRAQWNVSMEGQYLLKHVNSGLYLYLHDNYKEGKASNATTLRSVGTPFVLAQDGSGYTITKAGSDKTLGCATGTWNSWNTTNSIATSWNIVDAGNGNVYITSPKGYLGPNLNEQASGSYIYTNHPQRDDVKWQLVEAETVAQQPADGKFFALYNACKSKGAKFEYRIIQASDDPAYNIVSSFNSIKSYFYY